MVLKIMRFINLFATGLLAGFLVAVALIEHAILSLSSSMYTALQQPKHRLLEPVMPTLNTIAIVSALLVLLLLLRSRHTTAVALVATGFVCSAAVIIISLLVNVPINADIINNWSVETPPAAWAQIRDRWNWYHNLRTVFGVMAFVCQLFAALWPRLLHLPLSRFD